MIASESKGILSGGLSDWLLMRSLSLPLAFLTLLLVFLVSPEGNFPLNDDWVYGKSVQDTLQQGRIVVHPYAAALGLTHVLWGNAFVHHLGGFSFTTLRVSTIILAFVGAYATAAAMRTLGQSRPVSLLCGTIVLVNPLYVNLSYTFMTDVPFIAATALSGLFYMRALRYGQTSDILIATFFSIVATCNRQYGILVWAAYGMTLFMLWLRRGTKPPLRQLVTMSLPWLASIPIIYYWIATRETENPLIIDVPPSDVYNDLANWMSLGFTIFTMGLLLLPILIAYGYARFTRFDRQGRPIRYSLLAAFVLGYLAMLWFAADPSTIFVDVLGRFGALFLKFWVLCGYFSKAISYLGLFLLPVGLARATVILRGVERWTRPQLIVFGAFIVVFFATNFSSLPLPSMPNMITDLGIGPKTLTDSYRINPGWTDVSIGRFAWWIITVLTAISGGILFNDLIFNGLVHLFDPHYLKERPRADWLPHQEIFLLFWAVLMIVAPYNPFIIEVYDRYILQAIVPCCLLCTSRINLSRSAGWGRRALVTVTLVIMAVFSVAGLQDYMAWNRARWDAAEILLQTPRVTPEDVDGGYEYNGWYCSDRALASGGTKGLMNKARNWWIVRDTYAISFTEREGYRIEHEVPYFSWLGMHTGKVLVLKREVPLPVPAIQ
jgi:hypothetical protein